MPLFKKPSIHSPMGLGAYHIVPHRLTDSDRLILRACVGRNLASMELLIIISSILRRYQFVLADPDKTVCSSVPVWAIARELTQ